MIPAAANTYLGLFAGLTIADGDSGGGGFDGGAARARRAAHPREQHRADRRIGRRIDRRAA